MRGWVFLQKLVFTLYLFFFMKNLLNSFKHFIAPQLCYGCSAQCTEPICSACLRKLDKPPSEALPAIFQNYPLPPSMHIFALWNFDKGGIIQKIQHALKYKNLPALGIVLGKWIGLGCVMEYREKTPDIVIPIPLSPLRFIERGYNQAEQLAIGITQSSPMLLETAALIRTKHTQTQTKLSHDKRWENMKDVFQVAKAEMVKGKTVLLVDDVLTTGATLASAALALYEAGAAQVDIAVLAYVH